MFSHNRANGHQSDVKQRCLVEFARVAAPGGRLPSPTSSYYV